MEYEYIKINGKNIKATKKINSIWTSKSYDYIEKHLDEPRVKKVGEKIIYELPIELHKEIPRVVEINNKRFYKADNTNPNLNYFKLIEM